jgi:hypothetical protein
VQVKGLTPIHRHCLEQGMRLPAVLAAAVSSLCAGSGAPSEPAVRSASPSLSAAAATVVRRYAAPEARQAVAVDAEHFYAITNAWIAKYEKHSGRRVVEWKGSPDGPIRHLNSGIVRDGRLYCAHSNYPETPMRSSIEVFDAATLRHVDSQGFGSGHGSATWIDARDDAWWVTFAHYAGKGGEPGRGPEHTKLVRYDRAWLELGAWTFPSAVIDHWDGMSSSGGAWAPDGRLVTTSHHGKELLVLRPPTASPVLELDAVVPFESEGQGIAIDTKTGLLWSIQRRTGEVLVSRLP